MSARFLGWLCIVGMVVSGALGMLNVMSLRFQSEAVGRNIHKLEASIAETKKELEGSRRARDLALDTLQLQMRVGDTLKPPIPDQVVWVRYFQTAPVTSPLFKKVTPSPRSTAREMALLSTKAPGGSPAR